MGPVGSTSLSLAKFPDLFAARLNEQRRDEEEGLNKPKPQVESTEQAPQPSLRLSPNGDLVLDVEKAQEAGLVSPFTIEDLLARQSHFLPKSFKPEPPGEATELLRAVAPVEDVRLGTETYLNQSHTGQNLDIKV